MKADSLKITKISIWIIAIAANIKSIFYDYDLDAAYNVVMAWRRAKGDALFLEMWEPHQTSSFMNVLFIKIWNLFTNSTEGIIIWLQICGSLFFLAISLMLAKQLSVVCDELTANIIGAGFYLLRPKASQILDYSNLLIAFSTVSFLFLILYLTRQKTIWTVCLALSVSAGVLAYPTFIIGAIAIGILLLIYSKDKKGVFIYGGTIIAIAAAYILLVLPLNDFAHFTECVRNIFAGDSHSESVYSAYSYFREMVWALGMSGVAVILSAIAKALFKIVFHKNTALTNWVIGAKLAGFSCFSLLFVFRTPQGGFSIKTFYMFAFVVFIFLGLLFIRDLSEDNKFVYICGLVVSISCPVSTMLLTNLSFATNIAYIQLAGFLSLWPIYSHFRKQKPQKMFVIIATGLLFAFLLFNRMIFVTNTACSISIGEADTQVKYGPAKGLFTESVYAKRYDNSIDEWKSNVRPDDVVLYAEGWGIDGSFYLLSQASIGTNSTISTPVYNDTKILYWEMNPEKYPTVIAIPCWNGVEERSAGAWMDSFVDTNYECVYMGEYWHFYR